MVNKNSIKKTKSSDFTLELSKLVEVLTKLGKMYAKASPEVKEQLHKAIKEAEKNV